MLISSLLNLASKKLYLLNDRFITFSKHFAYFPHCSLFFICLWCACVRMQRENPSNGNNKHRTHTHTHWEMERAKKIQLAHKNKSFHIVFGPPKYGYGFSIPKRHNLFFYCMSYIRYDHRQCSSRAEKKFNYHKFELFSVSDSIKIMYFFFCPSSRTHLHLFGWLFIGVAKRRE